MAPSLSGPLLSAPRCDLDCEQGKQDGDCGIMQEQKDRREEDHPRGRQSVSPAGSDCPPDHHHGDGIKSNGERIAKTNSDFHIFLSVETRLLLTTERTGPAARSSRV